MLVEIFPKTVFIFCPKTIDNLLFFPSLSNESMIKIVGEKAEKAKRQIEVENECGFFNFCIGKP